jgi:hypothetical protein
MIPRSDRRSTLSSSKILQEEEITRVRTKFIEEIEFNYEEAIARHVSKPIVIHRIYSAI